MIQSIRIQNLKSIHDLTLDLGRINVIIGENGSGKSNILEAVAMAGAAEAGMISSSILFSRGVRYTSADLMRSAFKKNIDSKNIHIHLNAIDGSMDEVVLHCDEQPYSSWVRIPTEDDLLIKEDLKNLLKQSLKNGFDTSLLGTDEAKRGLEKLLKKLNEEEVLDNDSLMDAYADSIVSRQYGDIKRQVIFKEKKINDINTFLIYAPENHFLRQFEENVEVLGVRGEGLFELLTILEKESPEQLDVIKQHLGELLGWFEDFEIPENLFSTERRISIKDRYLNETLRSFDQRSANEGFLYLLFYFTLFVSKYTPKFFAIDNIDNALNPRLCSELMRVLSKLAKEYDKQALITTHNPSVLDGLDLNDDEQRLFVVSRNQDGHTQVRRIMPSKPVPGQPPVRLSEQFIRGYIGGLPKNF